MSEEGVIEKPWGGKLTVALTYPNRYALGMSNLGFQTVYHLLNGFPDVLCERTFLPEEEELEEFERTDTPLFSLESQRPLSEFDCLFFSTSFENDYPNILTLLKLARLPLLAERRSDHEPVIAGGGVTSLLNPEPLASFFDFFFIGEAEPIVPEVIEALRSLPPKKTGKGKILKRLARIEGIYVPSLYTVSYTPNGLISEMEAHGGAPARVTRRWCDSLDLHPTHTRLSSAASSFADLHVVEVNRGCPRGCRFCAAAFVYGPYRTRSLEAVKQSVLLGNEQGKRIGLLGTAVSDYPHLSQLADLLLESQKRFSVGSLRIDRLSEALARKLKEAGCKSIALAPEAASDRLRRVIRKGVSEEDIFEAVETIARVSLSNLKLYFMVGLPAEVREDVEEIPHLVRRLNHHVVKASQGNKHLKRMTLSINAFIPKPFTPFQWHPMERIDRLKEKLRFIRQALRRDRRVVVTAELPKWAYIQCLLSRGDRRVGKILLEAFRWGSFARAFQELDINPDFYVYRLRSADELFPWDFIDHGVDKKSLRSEYERALGES